MDFQTELLKMEERLTDLESKIDQIDSKLNQVVEALVGNPLIGNKDGLASKIERIENDVEDLREFKKKIIYTVSVIVTIGLMIQYFIGLISDIKK